LSEKSVNITEKIAKISETVGEYKNSVVAALKDMDVEVKESNFSVSRVDDQYNIDLTLKLTVKAKKSTAAKKKPAKKKKKE
jgi:hypothetical protein